MKLEDRLTTHFAETSSTASVDRGNLDSAYFSTAGIPGQVGDLARELTDGLVTDYDKVLALQTI